MAKFEKNTYIANSQSYDDNLAIISTTMSTNLIFKLFNENYHAELQCLPYREILTLKLSTTLQKLKCYENKCMRSQLHILQVEKVCLADPIRCGFSITIYAF